MSLLIGVVAWVAFATHAWYLEAHPPLFFFGQDDTWYDAVATSIARGNWGRVVGSQSLLTFSIRFPWGFPAVLAAGQRLLFWMPPLRAHLWTSVLLGTAAAGLIVLLAWRVTDGAPVRMRTVTAAVAGLLFAINPLLVGAPTGLMAEVLTVPLVCIYLLLVDRVLTGHRGRWTWIGLGVTIAAAGLTRAESLAFLGAATVIVVVLRADRRALGKGCAVAIAIGVVAVAAWSVVASRAAGRPVFVAANSGSLLFGANCPETLHGEAIGSWSGGCTPSDFATWPREIHEVMSVQPTSPFGLGPQFGARIEADVSARQLRAALRALREDPGGVLGAMPVRLARGLGVYWSPVEDRLTRFEGRDTTWEARGRWFHALLVLPLVFLGLLAFAWRRSRLGRALGELADRQRLAPAVVLIAVWCVLVLGSYGSARLRAPLEPVFALLAGLGAASLWSSLVARARRGESGVTV